jgi:DNA invertase Pin-like site-specific DNA recombinase
MKIRPPAGTRLMREYDGQQHFVTVLTKGFEYQGKVYRSLSGIATTHHGHALERYSLLRVGWRCAMSKPTAEQPRRLRCAIYTRKSSEEGLDQEYNSLDAQRDAGEAYIASQKHEGWMMVPEFYDDGGFSGGNLERPALKRLLDDIRAGKIDIVVVYKVDRISRSLTDFASIVQIFDQHNVSFVSVTQNFNTTSSMGRLTLNILLSFAQFEREVIGERIRDKFAASKRKGIFMGGAHCRWVTAWKTASSMLFQKRPRLSGMFLNASSPSNRLPSCLKSFMSQAIAPSIIPAAQARYAAGRKWISSMCIAS